MKDPVRGTALVVSVTAPSDNGVYTDYHMTLVVSAPGVPPTTVEREGTARTSKWPWPGENLPVTVDRADPTRLRVEWGEVPAGRRREQSLAMANEIAARMRGEGTSAGAKAGGIPPGPVVSRTIVTVNGRQADASAAQAVQEALSEVLGEKLDPAALPAVEKLVAQGGTRAGETTVVVKRNDAAGRLRVLEALRASGLVTDEEFNEKRKRILDAV